MKILLIWITDHLAQKYFVHQGTINKSPLTRLLAKITISLKKLHMLLDSVKKPISFRSIGEKYEPLFYKDSKIVFSTIAVAGRSTFDKLEFRTVIIDEAAMVPEALSIIVLMRSVLRLVLVGDPKQLRATILSQLNQRNNFDRSLLGRLMSLRWDQHLVEGETRNLRTQKMLGDEDETDKNRIGGVESEALASFPALMLKIQYRMEPELSAFPSHKFYDGKIVDAPGLARGQRKHLPSWFSEIAAQCLGRGTGAAGFGSGSVGNFNFSGKSANANFNFSVGGSISGVSFSGKVSGAFSLGSNRNSAGSSSSSDGMESSGVDFDQRQAQPLRALYYDWHATLTMTELKTGRKAIIKPRGARNNNDEAEAEDDLGCGMDSSGNKNGIGSGIGSGLNSSSSYLSKIETALALTHGRGSSSLPAIAEEEEYSQNSSEDGEGDADKQLLLDDKDNAIDEGVSGPPRPPDSDPHRPAGSSKKFNIYGTRWWLDTKNVMNKAETRNLASTYENHAELEIVDELVKKLRKFIKKNSNTNGNTNANGVSEKPKKSSGNPQEAPHLDLSHFQIGITSPYSGQVKLLEARMSKKHGHKKVQVRSIDGFQGSEVDIMIFSCVRSNKRGNVGFCKNPARLNVAITRARYALWIVGDSATLSRGKCSEFQNGRNDSKLHILILNAF
jgi:hypothetical protein